MTYLANAFSLQMVQTDCNISIRGVDPADVPADITSAIGHVDTAAVVSTILGREVPCNRANVSLEKGDVLFVAQVMGGRLPEGATTLPEGFRLEFRRVEIL